MSKDTPLPGVLPASEHVIEREVCHHLHAHRQRRRRGLDQEVQPMIYAPFQQDGSGLLRFVSFVARTATPAAVAEGIRAEIRRAAPDLPIEATRTMDDAVALGAERRDVLRLVLTRALRIVAAGLIAGLAGAAGVTRVLQRFLFGVTPTDPIVFTIVTLLLLAVGLMAAWLPARQGSIRATRYARNSRRPKLTTRSMIGAIAFFTWTTHRGSEAPRSIPLDSRFPSVPRAPHKCKAR